MAKSKSDQAERDWRVREFRNALLALAADGDIALAIYPKNCARADELALDFDHWLSVARGHREVQFDEAQLALLDAIDAQFNAMSGKANAQLWTEDAVRTSPEWEKVRAMARKALVLLGWPQEPPNPM